ncbi:MAG: type 1 glutamine amidotransferase [Breznakia sp.]
MKLRILWMYHNIMDLYGDHGNIQVLKRRCQKRHIEVIVDTCAIGETKSMKKYDLLFIGGGADHEQRLLHKDLLQRKTDILQANQEGMFILLVCGGFQFFGQYYIDATGKKMEGLKFFDYYTQNNQEVGRCIGNIVIEANLDGEIMEVVGFENHGGQTKNVKTPFGKVIKGHGNIFQGEYEGFYNGKVLATYIHGPLLPKNPKVADFVIRKALVRNYGNVELIALDDTLEYQAQKIMIQRTCS